MPPPTLTVTYAGQPYRIPRAAAGGTAAAPTLRAGEELLLDWLAERPAGPVNVLNDVDGVLATVLGQRAAARVVHRLAGPPAPPVYSVLADFPPAAPNLLLLPRSLDTFEQYVAAVARTAGPDTALAVAFPTRFFTPRLPEIAARYARGVAQSRARRKYRLLLLDQFAAPAAPPERWRYVDYAGHRYPQAYGSFSAGQIDYGTQFLLDCWDQAPELRDLPAPARLLDACCGGGILAHRLHLRYPGSAVAGYDNSVFALASARRLLAETGGDWARFFFADALPPAAPPYDLIVTNPPFHAGRRTTVAPARALFAAAPRALTPGGRLVVVGNRHLGYGKHLADHFPRVTTVAENDKFAVYRADR